MQDLIEQERFEIEMLDRLNSGQFLRFLVFEGGTMLRLCHGLDRYSIDLDFYMIEPEKYGSIFLSLKAYLSEYYMLRDAADKHYTLLFELRSQAYPRSLKIEIRKENKPYKIEQAIAFSPHSTNQVLLNSVSLQDMMAAKTKAFLNRGEIRDVYDMEFLFKRGIKLVDDAHLLEDLLRRIDSLKPNDYSAKLGSLLEQEQRNYYITQHFKLLKAAIREQLSR